MIEADKGVSGKVSPSQRPGLSAALAAIERGEAVGLLVVKIDRPSRDLQDILAL